MKYTAKDLAPGIHLLVGESGRFKTNLFSVMLAVPLARESAGANALIPEVLFRGCRRLPDIGSLSAETDRLYGADIAVGVRRIGETQCVTLRCAAADDRFIPGAGELLERSVALLGEILLDPVTEGGAFRRDYVESEGANLADRIRSVRADKIAWANRQLIREMCRGEAFSIPQLGEAEEALAMTPGRLWQAYRTLLEQAQVIFCCCGNAAPERVESAVRSAFAPLLEHGRVPAFRCQVPAHPAGPVRRVCEHMDVTQGKLTMGFRAGGITEGDDRYPAMLLCSALYGGTAHSRLFRHVRERLSLCYYADSVYDKLKGILVVSTGVEPENMAAAEAECLAQLEAIRRGDFTREELDLTVRALVSRLTMSRDSLGSHADWLLTGCLTGSGLPDPGGLIRALEAVSPEEVAATARAVELDTVYCLTGREGD